MPTVEANFDGLIGPTHNYGGLSDGNLASAKHGGLTSSPKQAALQGLEKMKMLADRGLFQGVLPPQDRPAVDQARLLGFSGGDEAVLAALWETDRGLARKLSSASSMWSANAATVSPSADSADGKLHLTPANLTSMLHRSIEAEQTGRALKAAFPFASVHDPLTRQSSFADEGAANHVRLCRERGEQGVELFVYGRDGDNREGLTFPARQTLKASQAVARLHQLNPVRTVYALQSAEAINAGAFHNDVVCVGALNTLFYHEQAFENTAQMQADVKLAADGLFEPIFVEVPKADVPIEDAIKSYLFNSMLIQFPGQDRLSLIAPLETQEMDSTRDYCERLVASNGPIAEVVYVDVRQSMNNGGGPACLRLRVTLSDEEQKLVNPKMMMNNTLYDELRAWVSLHYRDELAPADMIDPALMHESRTALAELTQILGLGERFYPFQRG